MNDAEPTELNLTPYLDVLMNLIVFVLVSGAGLVTLGVLPAKTASANGGGGGSVPRLHLERSVMSLSVGGAEPAAVTLDELPSRLARASGRALIVEGAPDITLEQVVSAMDAARNAGFDEVTLAD